MDIENLLQRLLLITVVTIGPILLLKGEIGLMKVMMDALL